MSDLERNLVSKLVAVGGTLLLVGGGIIGAKYAFAVRPKPSNVNLLQNGDFDSGALAPWVFTQTSGQVGGSATLDTAIFKTPPASARVTGTKTEVAALTQSVVVVAGGTYRLSGYVKATNLVGAKTGDGAYLSLFQAPSGGHSNLIAGTTGWLPLSVTLKATGVRLIAGCSISFASGFANYDTLVLQRIA